MQFDPRIKFVELGQAHITALSNHTMAASLQNG